MNTFYHNIYHQFNQIRQQGMTLWNTAIKPEYRQYRVSVCSAIWVGIICIYVFCIQQQQHQIQCETPLQRLQFAKTFVTQLHLQHDCDDEQHIYIRDTYYRLENHCIGQNVSNPCRHIARMFHPDKFMDVRNHRQVYSNADRQMLSQTYMMLFEYCKTTRINHTISETIIYPREPFSFHSSYYSFQNQSLQTPFSLFQSERVFLQDDTILHLNYVGSDTVFEGIVISVKCERKCSTQHQPKWICKDDTLPEFLTLSVVNLNCSSADRDAVIHCTLDYNIEYTYIVDAIMFSDYGFLIWWLSSMALFAYYIHYYK